MGHGFQFATCKSHYRRVNLWPLWGLDPWAHQRVFCDQVWLLGEWKRTGCTGGLKFDLGARMYIPVSGNWKKPRHWICGKPNAINLPWLGIVYTVLCIIHVYTIKIVIWGMVKSHQNMIMHDKHHHYCCFWTLEHGFVWILRTSYFP